MNVWESVKELQLLCERLDFKHIIIIIIIIIIISTDLSDTLQNTCRWGT